LRRPDQPEPAPVASVSAWTGTLAAVDGEAQTEHREETMRKLISILAIPLIAAACTGSATGTPSGTAAGTASSAPSQAAAKYQVATGADSLILQIASEGGFISPSFQLTRTPLLALYGDGRVIVPGAVDASLPQPLLPNLRQQHVTPAEIQKILAAADAAGLLGPDATYGGPGMPDAPNTVFRTTVAGVTHIINASAEGVGAQTKLGDFENSVLDLSTLLGRTVADDGPYQPAGLNVFSSVAAQPDATAPVVTWPLSADPATAGGTTLVDGVRCLAVKGADLAPFLAAAKTATGASVWKAPSGEYSVSVRPLYPEESGCPAG
jgi:hypothetical protein